MKRAGRLFALAIVGGALWTSVARSEVLAEYTYMPGDAEPQNQGWTWNGAGEVNDAFTNLFVQESSGSPNFLFSKTVPANVFFDQWSFTGNNRLPGNSQEEFGMMMFADDGTNFWHMSFRNAANRFDGIYMGGDPAGPVLEVTAQLVWPEDPNPGPFDSFHNWTLIDSGSGGGAPPKIQLDGVDLMVDAMPVAAIPAPSMFPAGTVGWGSLNDFEGGFFQTTHMVFEGNPNATSPSLPGDYNGNMAVDAADFVVWRKNLGAADESALNGNGDGMNGVDQGDYALWRSKFGMTAGGITPAVSAGLVPEPHSVALVVSGILVFWPFCRQA